MPDTLTVDVVDVTDGDTLVVKGAEGQTAKAWLWGIDAPETGQPFETEATAVARKEAEGKRVEVEVIDTGPYGRLVGRVHAGGTTLGRILARSGYAWHARRYPTSRQIKQAEQEARRNKRGLWTQSDPVPPWEYRKGTVAVDEDGSLVGWIVAFFVILVAIVALLT